MCSVQFAFSFLHSVRNPHTPLTTTAPKVPLLQYRHQTTPSITIHANALLAPYLVPNARLPGPQKLLLTNIRLHYSSIHNNNTTILYGYCMRFSGNYAEINFSRSSATTGRVNAAGTKLFVERFDGLGTRLVRVNALRTSGGTSQRNKGVKASTR
jgi:hypothetical protein